MKRTLILITTALFLYYPASSQTNHPVFASPADSAAFARVSDAIQELSRQFGPMHARTNTNNIMDSLLKVRAGLMEKILGYRTSYVKRSGTTEWQELVQGNISAEEVMALSLRGMEFRRIPESIRQCRHLKELELWDTQIRKLPRYLNHLTSLKTIYIYNTRRPLKLSRNDNIVKLVIRGSYQSHTPHTYRKFRNLETLDLSENISFTAFPDIFRNHRLIELRLNRNQITLTDLKHGKNHPALQKLFLQQNRINELPEGIARFPHLRELNLAVNKIQSVHDNLSTLQELTELSFYINALPNIPPSIYKLPKLETIDLYFNNIDTIGEQLGQLTRLKILYLSNNRISRLPESLGQLKELQELYVHNNRLSYLPESVSQLAQLKTLRINNNRFTTFPEQVLKLKNLEYLDVADNELHELPQELTLLDKLKILVLRNNRWADKAALQELCEIFMQKGVVVHL